MIDAMIQNPVLEMKGITKTYPGVRALDGVDLVVQKGEVHALLGENGAGKSTLVKILAGAQPMNSGEILLNGRPVDITSPQKAMELGISIIYQELILVPYMTVAENVFLGREPTALLPGFVNYAKMCDDAQNIIDGLGVTIDARAVISTLSIAQQQIVEIAKALSEKSPIIVMDEPTATLTSSEIDKLFELIRMLKATGVSIIYISHRMEEIFEIADRVTVLRDGQLVGTHDIGELDQQKIIQMMVGRDLEVAVARESSQNGDVVLEVKDLSTEFVRDVSFKVKSGEVLGISGLVGAGRTEIARAIFGVGKIDRGEIFIDGKKTAFKRPSDAIREGIGFVTEDRKSLGLVLSMTVRDNITLSNIDAVVNAGFVQQNAEKQVAQQYVDDLAIKTPGIEQLVQYLSGGNQQKVVLAKWLFRNPKVMIFDEPTRGIDVAAKAEIYNLINALAAKGTAIIMISSELAEILAMSDRILVMHEGRMTGELMREDATQEKIMHLAMSTQGRRN